MATTNAADIGIVVGGGATETFPTNTDTVLGRTSTDVLQNKTILVSGNNIISGGYYSLTTNQAVTALATVLTGATWTMPANFAVVSMVLHLRATYRFVKTLSPPTLVANLTVAGVSVATFTVANASSATTSGGEVEATITIVSTGATGSLMSALLGGNNHGSTAADNNPMTVNIATTAINTTITNAIALTLNMGTAVASNTITISQGYVDIIKL